MFAFAFPELFTLTEDFGSELIIKASKTVSSDVNNMGMQMVLGYTSYFVLGYYLDVIELCRRQRIVIYVLGVVGFLFTIVIDMIVALKTQTCCDNYYGNFNLNVLFEAVAVYIFFKYRKFGNEKINAFVQKMSKLCFGAYLVHTLIIEQLDIRLGLNTLSFNSVLAVLTLGIIVFVVSFAISALLNRIPIINQYIV